MKNYVSEVVKLINDALVKYENPQAFYYYMKGLIDMLNVVDALANDEEPNTANVDESDQETFFEPLSGRYFKSSTEEVMNAVANANMQIAKEVYITINEWFDHLRLDPIWGGSTGGWKIEEMLAVDIVKPEKDDHIRVPRLVYRVMPSLFNDDQIVAKMK